ncbi:DNA repair exonuclease [bacterium]|nr:DNA repair exonuclease [bacterium]
MFKFVHAADLHLGKIFFRGEGKIDQILINSTFKAFEGLIKLCLDEDVDFLLIAGDIFDSEELLINIPYLFKFKEGLAKLDKKGIRAFLSCGNHDPLDAWKIKFDWPPNVYFFPSDKYDIQKIITKSCDTVILHGISYKKKNDYQDSNPLSLFKKTDDSSAFEIGLLHCNVESNKDHGPYASCSKNDLVNIGLDYWALGHIHKGGIIPADTYLVYPGNTQGLKINESGKKGCYIVEVENNQVITPEFKVLSRIVWETFEIDITNVETIDNIISLLEEECMQMIEKSLNCSFLLRVILNGRNNIGSDLNPDELDKIIGVINEKNINNEPFYWITEIISEVKPYHDLDKLMEDNEFLGDLLRAGMELRKNPNLKDAMSEIFKEFESKKELKEIIKEMDNNSLNQILQEAEYLCVDKLLE